MEETVPENAPDISEPGTNRKPGGALQREVYLRLPADWRLQAEWEKSELREWERLNTEEGKGERNQERRRRAETERERGAGSNAGISGSAKRVLGLGVSARVGEAMYR